MKVTKSKLKRIITEELQNILSEVEDTVVLSPDQLRAKKAAARDFPRRLHPTRYLCTPVILKTHQQRRAYQGFNPLAYCKNKFCL